MSPSRYSASVWAAGMLLKKETNRASRSAGSSTWRPRWTSEAKYVRFLDKLEMTGYARTKIRTATRTQ